MHRHVIVRSEPTQFAVCLAAANRSQPSREVIGIVCRLQLGRGPKTLFRVTLRQWDREGSSLPNGWFLPVAESFIGRPTAKRIFVGADTEVGGGNAGELYTAARSCRWRV
jgi:hypothetical protein